jgi:hypothetical protein
LLSLGLGLVTASSVSKNGLLARVRGQGAEIVAMLAFSLDRTHKAVGHIVMQHFPQITAPQGPASWLLYAVTCSSAALLLHIVVERSFLCRRDRVTRHKPASALEDEMPGARAVIARMDALVPKFCEKRGGRNFDPERMNTFA